MRPLAAAIALGLAAAIAPAHQGVVAQQVTSGTGAVLRGLDKVAGASTDIELAVGESTRYGRLSITLSECRYPAVNPASEAFAHLTIHDTLHARLVFDGWMIASSPALNAMDHARYDIWVLRCTTTAEG